MIAVRADSPWRHVALLSAGFWAATIAVTTARDLANGEPMLWGYAELTLFEYVLSIIVSAPVALCVFASRRLARPGRVALLVAIVLTTAAVHCWIDAIAVVRSARVMGVAMPPFDRMIVRSIVSFLLMHGLFVMTLELMRSAMTVRESERRLAAAHSAAQAAQLAALRFQLNPHFLFNTLNAISSLIVTGRNADAEQVTMKLSEFLRASLEADPEGEVPLDEELATTQSYLDIEAIRFGDRLHLLFECPAMLLGALVPSFLLQPLVENAIKYAVAPSRRTVTLAVRAFDNGEGNLRIVVEDDGRQAFGVLPPGGTGLGLANVRQRLAAFYGGAASVEAMATDRGFAVTLTLPLRLAERVEQAA